jgi:lipid-binding SYLF domain-containing protein
MVDMSLKGTSVETDVDDISACYAAQITPADILNGSASPPREAVLLYNAIKDVIKSYRTP